MIYNPVLKADAKERGATILEFSIGVLIFFMIAGVIVEFARILTVQAILTRAAQRGLSLAITIDGISEPTYGLTTGNEEYDRYIAARNRVIQTSIDFAEGLLVARSPHDDNAPYGGAGSGGMQLLIPYELPDPTDGLVPGAGAETSSVVLLRPGDYANMRDAMSGSVGTQLDHPALCPTSGCTSSCIDISGNACPTITIPNSQSTVDQILLEYPLVVEMRARVQPVLPFLPPLTVVGKAVGYRELYPESGISDGVEFTTTTTTTSTTTTTTVSTTTVSTVSTTMSVSTTTVTGTTTTTVTAPSSTTMTTGSSTSSTVTTTITTTVSTTLPCFPCSPGKIDHCQPPYTSFVCAFCTDTFPRCEIDHSN